MSEPATRLDDELACIRHTSTGPVRGPGSPEVFVRGVAMARLTDLCDCPTPHSSPLAEGAAEVLVDGLPAARIGVKTLEGGVILSGEPSVLIGGGTFELPAFIDIVGEADFQAKVIRDLFKISTTPSGQKLFASMAEKGHRLQIYHNVKPNGHETFTDPLNSDPDSADVNDHRAYDNTGIGAQIGYDPDATKMPAVKKFAWAHPPNCPSDAQLFHEMVHADDMMHGRLDKTECRNVGEARYGFPTRRGELRAAGLPPYDNESNYPYSENTYRRDRGLPRREFY